MFGVGFCSVRKGKQKALAAQGKRVNLLHEEKEM
jgi:hypothetical protein